MTIRFIQFSYENYFLFIIAGMILCFGLSHNLSYAQPNANTSENMTETQEEISLPTLTDANLQLELVASGLDFPTSIGFLSDNDMLVLEKNTGDIIRIKEDGKISEPIFHVDVSHRDERGLLGLALGKMSDFKPVKKKNQDDYFVFLYLTKCPKGESKPLTDEDDKDLIHLSQISYDRELKEDFELSECENQVYRYNYDPESNEFSHAKLLLRLPALPGPSHNGGIIKIGSDKNLYITVGDLIPSYYHDYDGFFTTKAQNNNEGRDADGRAGILRIDYNGDPVLDANNKGLLGDDYPLNLYYAYGIRNSFGIDFDPLTGNLWESENGPLFGDEINLIYPGFNGGTSKIQGFWISDEFKNKTQFIDEYSDIDNIDLVNFNGKGKLSFPKFVWDNTIGPTALVFLDSSKLGENYTNDILVGSVDDGMIYHLKLNDERNDLVLNGALYDRIANNKQESIPLLFGEKFGIITDLKISPNNGYLYIVTGYRSSDQGAIYKVSSINHQ